MIRALLTTGPDKEEGHEAGGPPFAELSPPARVFVVTVVLTAAVLLLFQAPQIRLADPRLFTGLLLLSGIATVFKVNVPLSTRGATMPVSYAVDFAALLLIGPDATMVVAATSAFSQATFGATVRAPLYRTAFGMAAVIITVQAAGHVYLGAGGILAHHGGPAGIQQPVLAAAAAYFLVNTALCSGAAALMSRQPLWRLWNEDALWNALSYFVGAGTGAVGAFLLHGDAYWLLPLAGAPLYLTYRAYTLHLERIEAGERHVVEISELHLATIEALALAIDAKDQTATSHVRRVQAYAAGLAQALGMAPNEVQGVRTAALLHDIGKLAVPEHILSKPGPLTQEEFEKIQIHPQIGAEIIGAVPFPYPVAPLIAAHHERWDGRGYPQGLRGEDIPLGARILAVVDYFDALTSERPYHAAQTTEEAVATIAAEAGKALDPKAVQVFLDLLPALEAEAERLGEPSQRLSFAAGTNGSAAPSAGFAPQRATKAFQDIALAHREISALYEIAQGLGTTLSVSEAMELISTKLNHLVPFATSALFLYDEENDILRCRHASGVDAELMQQISLKLGQGLIGWVARNRRPLVNARPSADFEAAGMPDTTTLNAALVCPLVFDGRLVGALALYHPQSGCYNDDHRRMLDRVCEQAAGVVNNAVLFERTKHDSLTDALTGLPNARYMLVHLTRELARAERLQSEVTLFVMDLDGFKTINDQYGHHVGDRALREVARVLRSGIRPYDICVRYAGDEFVVVLSGCGPDEAEHKRLELQQAIQEIPFEVRPGRFLKLGSSFGAASFPRDGRSHETLLATADSRMYEDKAQRKRAQEEDAQAGTASPARAKRPSVFAKIETRPAANRTH